MTSETNGPPGYRLVRQIGRGGSSVVWEARQLSTGRQVALKMLEVDITDPDALRRFEREREVMSALASHPGIVTIYDAGVHEQKPWLAMEFCARGSLARHVTETGPLDPATATAVLRRCAAALGAAHERAIVHCDVKPANIMLTDHGEPAIGDFGIARVSVGRATTTTVGGYSLDHVAPELLDDGSTSVASDVYSLGTTIWELLSGRPPFRDQKDVSAAVVMRRVMTRPIPDPPEGTPSELTALLRAMTAKDPRDRPADMGTVAAAAAAIPELDARAETPFPPVPFDVAAVESESLAAAHAEPMTADAEWGGPTWPGSTGGAADVVDAEPTRRRDRPVVGLASLEPTAAAKTGLARRGPLLVAVASVVLLLAAVGGVFAYRSVNAAEPGVAVATGQPGPTVTPASTATPISTPSPVAPTTPAVVVVPTPAPAPPPIPPPVPTQPSDGGAVTPPPPTVDAPGDLTAVRHSDSSPRNLLTWSAPDLDGWRLVGYQVKAEGAADGGTFTKTVTDTTLQDAANYCSPSVSYEVRTLAFPQDGGAEVASAPATAQIDTEVNCRPPLFLKSVTATGPNSAQVIYYCTGSGRGGQSSADVTLTFNGDDKWNGRCTTNFAGPPMLAADVTGLDAGTTYTVAGTASNVSGQDDSRNSLTFTTPG